MKRLVVGAAALVAAAAGAAAQSPSPYDMTYTLRGGDAVPLRADMSDKAKVLGTIPAGTTGIVLRWCRSEIPFGTWQFGSQKEQMKLLDERWCEVAVGGVVGNVPGSALRPE
jgi:hypothetical protein